ncbi:hypothetical protein JCM11251_004661 [Rhodosporidiobolus azoricus]
MATPTYSPIPANDNDEKHLLAGTAPLLSSHEKPSLSRSSTEELTHPATTNAHSARKAAFKAALVTTAVLAFGGIGTVGLFCSPDDSLRAWTELKAQGRSICGYGGRGYGEGGEERRVKRAVEGEWRWWAKRQEGEGEGVEEFSTSTFKDGRTSTFVKTTRPIVNPGGFTIGTLTGYVPTLINGTTVGQPTATSSPVSASSSSTSATATEDTSDSFSRETSSVPTSWYAAPTAPASSSSDEEGETVFVTETTTITEPASTSTATTTTTVTQTETITAAPSADARLAKRSPAVEEWDFEEVEAQLRWKRAVVEDGEREGKGEGEEGEQASGKEEYSTSVNRKGDITYTLVKTTRPIINAGGYTIGTLDGAWVDVAKQTDRPSSSSSFLSSINTSPSTLGEVTTPPTATPSTSAEHRRARVHEELRKRDEGGVEEALA